MAAIIKKMIFDCLALGKLKTLGVRERGLNSRNVLSLGSLHSLRIDVTVGSDDLPAGTTFDNGVIGWVIFGSGKLPTALVATKRNSNVIGIHGDLLSQR